jgi:hypothetical protein
MSDSLQMSILRKLSVRDLNGYGIARLMQHSAASELLAEESSIYTVLQT